MIKDNRAYADAIILVMSTVLMAFIIIICVMPVHDQLKDNYVDQLIASDNQFYTETIQNRLNMAGDLGWKAPFGFIAIGFIYCIIRVIKRQQYTEYVTDEYE